MDEDECLCLLLSQRECMAISMDIRSATKKAEVAVILQRHELTEDDLLAGFPDLAKVVQELPDEGPPDT
ncbi:hypothetical protein [Streptomyces sp. NPDC003717]|uniref:hypothetical protein n=1 Tax=Streptomyces sp. NPDC003717 TaxID=3154276 RepID=UPI0033A69582